MNRPAVHAGFPNAADYPAASLDLNRLLTPRPASSYYFRVRGDQHHSRGILDGDIAVVDRAMPADDRSLVVYSNHDGFELDSRRQPDGQDNPQIWGVVTAVIRQLV